MPIYGTISSIGQCDQPVSYQYSRLFRDWKGSKEQISPINEFTPTTSGVWRSTPGPGHLHYHACARFYL